MVALSPLMSNPISTCIFHSCQQIGDARDSCGDEALRGPHGLFFCHCGPRKLSEVAGIRPSLHLSKLHVLSSVVLANAARWSGCGFTGVSRTLMRPGPPCRRAFVSHKAASPNIAVATAQAPRSLSRRRPSARDIAGYGLRHSAQFLAKPCSPNTNSRGSIELKTAPCLRSSVSSVLGLFRWLDSEIVD